MAIILSADTQQLIESRMKDLGFDSTDEFLRLLVQSYDVPEVLDYDDLDAETRAAIEEGEREIQQGLVKPWAEVKAELFAKYVKQ